MYYKVKYQQAHQNPGTNRPIRTRFIKSGLPPSKIFLNRPKIIAGCNRVIEVYEITKKEYVKGKKNG
jgi:hypothetical protein